MVAYSDTNRDAAGSNPVSSFRGIMKTNNDPEKNTANKKKLKELAKSESTINDAMILNVFTELSELNKQRVFTTREIWNVLSANASIHTVRKRLRTLERKNVLESRKIGTRRCWQVANDTMTPHTKNILKKLDGQGEINE